MKQVNAFMASDGTLHADPESCVSHELTIGLRPVINKFFEDENRYGQSARSGYTKILLRWEAFKLRQSCKLSEADHNVG